MDVPKIETEERQQFQVTKKQHPRQGSDVYNHLQGMQPELLLKQLRHKAIKLQQVDATPVKYVPKLNRNLTT